MFEDKVDCFVSEEELLSQYGIAPATEVFRNLSVNELYEAAVKRGQAKILANGALFQNTSPYFGRAAKSSFYVRDPEWTYNGHNIDDLIAWGNPNDGEYDNLPISRQVFQKLHAKVVAALSTAGDLYVTDAFSGRTERSQMSVRVVTCWAQSALFARNIFLRPADDDLNNFSADW